MAAAAACGPGRRASSSPSAVSLLPLLLLLLLPLVVQSLLQLQDQTVSVLCTPSDVPDGGFGNTIPMVMRGNCTFYEKVRLAQINGARGLLIVSREKLVPPAGNWSQYEEIDIPVALLSYTDMLDIGRSFGHSVKVAMYAPNEPVLDYNMVIIFVMAVGTVAIGGYWAGSRDVKKRYMKHKRDDGAEKQEDETVDVTPIMICIFVVMCCSMLVLLYCFYDQLVYVIIGIFCLAASIGLYSCLSPFVRWFPIGKCRVPDNNLPYFHKRPQIRMLLLAAFCVAVSLVWAVFRNEDQWAWILQDMLGIAFCLYMLKTIRLPTFKKDLPPPPLVISPVGCPADPKEMTSPVAAVSQPEEDDEVADPSPPVAEEPAHTLLSNGEPPAPFLETQEEEEEVEQEEAVAAAAENPETEPSPAPLQAPHIEDLSPPKGDCSNASGSESPPGMQSQSD
ncbi:hypothetical protein JD844_034400 [Phrynosoma platyrhinos]|uniref:PA domain-containing protein n=1 Tax=Phrynosoma platyrhinos TaxID=52577 RepID=A0ABQ7T995_PHRPL|nr:hypothetical protein JD844_034400 [Phrynosoma platyrhinos]